MCEEEIFREPHPISRKKKQEQLHGLYPKKEKCLPNGFAKRRAHLDLNSRVHS